MNHKGFGGFLASMLVLFFVGCSTLSPKTLRLLSYCSMYYVEAYYAGSRGFDDVIRNWNTVRERVSAASMDDTWKATVAAVRSLDGDIDALDETGRFINFKLRDNAYPAYAAAYVMHVNVLLSGVQGNKTKVRVYSFCRVPVKEEQTGHGRLISSGNMERELFSYIDSALAASRP